MITQRILGAYHYEGGKQVYTITYGDRSMTDTEVDPDLLVKEETTKDDSKADQQASGDIWLYVGIGVLAALIVLAGVILVVKKKKPVAVDDDAAEGEVQIIDENTSTEE